MVREVKPKKVGNLFPKIADERVLAFLQPLTGTKEEDPEEFLARVKKRRLLDLERRSIEKELRAEIDEEVQETKENEHRRFSIINNQIVRDDDGEYSLNEAVKILAAQRNSQESSLVELARAMKELRPGETLDISKMITDIKALVPVPEVTRGEVELMVKNQALETRHAVERSLDELKDLISRQDNKDLVGQLTNIWQSLPDSLRNRLESVIMPSPGAMYKDGQGNAIPLPDWIQLKRLEIEIEEKAQAAKFKSDVIATARAYAPDILATLRSLRGEKSKGEQILEQAGWGDKPGTRENLTKQIIEQFHLVRVPCVSCGQEIVCTENTCSVICPHCQNVNVQQQIVKAEEQKSWQEQESVIDFEKLSKEQKEKSSKSDLNAGLSLT